MTKRLLKTLGNLPDLTFQMNAHSVKDGLYHRETGIPWHLFEPFAKQAYGLEYGQHARRAALDDRFGQLASVPLSYCPDHASVFEVEVEQGRIVKFAARLSVGFSVVSDSRKSMVGFGKAIDLILVCTPSLRDSNNLFVKTLWLNERTDGHHTLDKSKYIPYTL